MADPRPSVATGATLLLTPGSFGNEQQHEQLREDGQWQTVKSDVRLVQVGNQRMALSDAELQVLLAPMTNLADPQRTPPLVTPPLVTPLPTDDRATELPGYEAQAPEGPSGTTTPIEQQSWEDLLIERSASEKLGRSLEAAGQPKMPGYEAHHIVPSGAGGAEMAGLRAHLQSLGIDLDSAVNGVWLPGKTAPIDAPEAYHPRLKNGVYDDAVLNAFLGVNDRATAERTLQDIANDLRNRVFPGVRPRP